MRRRSTGRGGGPLLDLAPYYLTALVALLGPIDVGLGLRGARRRPCARSAPDRTRARCLPPRCRRTLPRCCSSRAGALATLTVSFEAAGQYLSGLEIYGSEATMRLPDANAFGGTVSLRRGGGSEPENVSYPALGRQETRGFGLHDLVESIGEGRPHMASDTHALHVLEAALAIGRSAAERRVIDLDTPSY